MRTNVAIWKLVLLGAAMTAGSAGSADAKARSPHVHASGSAAVHVMQVSAGGPGAKRVRIGGHGRKEAFLDHSARYSYSGGGYGGGGSGEGGSGDSSYGGGLQCVPFARENTGIELAGNASAWWAAAAGVYERGARPEVGSILNFRANGRMRSGHVAVVSNVEDARTVAIDHANWANHGGVSRNVTVVDVSPFNDWSAVRVALGHGGEFGSVYPTFGFIYDRPDHGALLANNVTAPMPNVLNPTPRDLRPADDRAAASDQPVEVAEAFTRVRYGTRRERVAPDWYHTRRYTGMPRVSHSRHKRY